MIPIYIKRKEGLTGRPERFIQWVLIPLGTRHSKVRIFNARSKKDISHKYIIEPDIIPMAKPESLQIHLTIPGEIK